MNNSPERDLSPVSLGVIGGSGAYNLLTDGVLGEKQSTTMLETPFGKSAPIHHFRAGNLHYLFLSRHPWSRSAPYSK